MKKVSTNTIIRTAVLVVALVNQVLVTAGKTALPILNDDLYALLSTILTAVTSIIAWWKNNSFTKEAIEADEYMNELKGVNK